MDPDISICGSITPTELSLMDIGLVTAGIAGKPAPLSWGHLLPKLLILPAGIPGKHGFFPDYPGHPAH
jgi:hypothetical protein